MISKEHDLLLGERINEFVRKMQLSWKLNLFWGVIVLYVCGKELEILHLWTISCRCPVVNNLLHLFHFRFDLFLIPSMTYVRSYQHFNKWDKLCPHSCMMTVNWKIMRNSEYKSKWKTRFLHYFMLLRTMKLIYWKFKLENSFICICLPGKEVEK